MSYTQGPSTSTTVDGLMEQANDHLGHQNVDKTHKHTLAWPWGFLPWATRMGCNER